MRSPDLVGKRKKAGRVAAERARSEFLLILSLRPTAVGTIVRRVMDPGAEDELDAGPPVKGYQSPMCPVRNLDV